MSDLTRGLQRVARAVTALLVLAAPSRAATIFVSSRAPGAVHDGASWATAFRTIQAGADAASPGDSIWVQVGIYYETVSLNTPGVSLLGGFQGGETDVAQRRAYARPILRSGNRPGAALSIGADDVTVDGFEISRTTGGGGPGLVVGGKRAIISRNTISGHRGGGIECGSGADGVALSDNLVTGNRGTLFGGILCGNATLLRNIIVNNSVEAVSDAAVGGGGVRVEQGTAVLKDNVIARNTVKGSSNASDPSGAARGGGVAIRNGTVRMLNNTVAMNTVTARISAQGAGIAVESGALELSNNILFGNVASPLVGAGNIEGGALWVSDDPAPGASVTGRNNLTYQNQPDNALPPPVTGTLYGDPLFVSSNDYHLKGGSPAIDAGDQAAVSAEDRDADGQPRILGPVVDIGAYESLLTTAPRTQSRTYVRRSGSDLNDGASWSAAKRTIGSALSVTAAGGEVWVAGGTYNERVTIPDGVGLYGGFVGDETDRGTGADRVFRAVLDAEYRGNAVIIPAGTTGVTLDGLTIRHGRGQLNYGYSGPFGGGIHSEGERVTVANVTVEDNEYWAYEDNPTAWGGGIYVNGGSITICNSVTRRNQLYVVQGMTFPQFGNIATANGGGIALISTTATIANNLIADNDITITGASSQYAALGAALFADNAKGRIVNNTIVGSTASETTYIENGYFVRFGGAVHFGPGAAVPMFANNIVAFNASGVRSGAAQLRHNNVYGNGTDYQGTNPTGTDGNISVDPLFVNRAAGDFRLVPSSPSVDTGDDTLVVGDVDLDANPRIAGLHVDMGAYETSLGAPLTIGDAAAALRVAAGLMTLSPQTRQRLDVVGADGVDLRDGAAIARAVSGQ